MNFFRNNILILVFVLSQLSMLYFAQLHDNVLGDVDISRSSVFHVLAIMGAILGYLIAKLNLLPHKSMHFNSSYVNNGIVFMGKKSVKILYVMIFAGLLTSILTVAVFVDISEYFQMLLSADSSILLLRDQSGKGGISGFFKMFNYAPLGIYMATSAFLFFLRFDSESNKRLQKVEKLSLLAVCIKVAFSLDRLTIMAVFVVQLYKLLLQNRRSWKVLIILLLGAGIADIVSSIRMSDNGGLLGLLITYCKLSLANFQLLLDKQEVFSYVGTSTFLHPLFFVTRFIGFDIDEVPIADHIWNSAQYFNAYLYMDFGYYSLLIYVFLGMFMSHVESKRRSYNFKYIGTYFFCIFVIVSFITVPFIRAIEFWFVLCIICFEAHLLKINTYK